MWYVPCCSTLPVASSTSATLAQICRKKRKQERSDGRDQLYTAGLPYLLPRRFLLAIPALLLPYTQLQAHRDAHSVCSLGEGGKVGLGGGEIGGVPRVDSVNAVLQRGHVAGGYMLGVLGWIAESTSVLSMSINAAGDLPQ